MFGFPKGLLGEWSRIRCKDVGFQLGLKRAGRTGKAARRKLLAFYDSLEDRALMATAGYDYLVSGFQWQNPSRITYSIAPDGVYWDHGTNALNASMDAQIGPGVWQREIARALATWQSVANINIVSVADGNFKQNNLGQSQGDPRFGDIRIGGYAFTNNQKTLAQAYFPPPQGSTAGGDLEINLNLPYKVKGTYDLYSVVLHETGHSLGLDHSTNKSVVMAGEYGGVRNGLTAGDVAGIQAIYGARKLDIYQSQGFGLSSNLPIDLTPGLVSANKTTASAASLNKIGAVEWFTFIAPSYASGSWQVTAAASNMSLLSPQVSVYDASGKLLVKAGNPSDWGDDATATVSSIVAGQRYLVSVTGDTNDVFDVGAYNLTVALTSSPPVARPTPTPTPAPVQTPAPIFTPSPIVPTTPIYSTSVIVAPDRYESNDTLGTATRFGKVNQGVVTGVTLHTASDVDYYTFQAGSAGTFQIIANGATVQVLNTRGKVVAQGVNGVNVNASRNSWLVVRVQSSNAKPLPSYGLSIALQPPAQRKVVSRVAPPPRFPVRKVAPIKAPARLARQEIPIGYSTVYSLPETWSTTMRTAAHG